MSDLGLYVPVGAEGYDQSGALVVDLASEGWLRDSSGQVIFKTAANYGNIDIEVGSYAVLVVAAGGGGAGLGANENAAGNGGGGGGGVLFSASLNVSTSPVSVIIGAGGAGGYASNGVNGGNSVFSSLSAIGGGGGGYGVTPLAGSSGGSGGGGGGWQLGTGTVSGGTGESGPPVQGYAGGTGLNPEYTSGGGGGASEAGGNATTDAAGDGGEGVSYYGKIYGSGGGGGTYADIKTPGVGGTNAGDAGNRLTHGGDGLNGVANTGGGGGGSCSVGDFTGGAGGSGVIIVRWGGYDPGDNFLISADSSISDVWHVRGPTRDLPGESAGVSDLWSVRSTYTRRFVKSVVFDCEDTFPAAFAMGIRSVDFYDENGVFIALTSGFFADATTWSGVNALPEFSFDTSLSKIGSYTYRQWLTGTFAGGQRLICTFDTPRIITKIIINNSHDIGVNTANGVRKARVYLSGLEVTNQAYAAALPEYSRLIFNGEFRQHISANVADPEVIWIEPNGELQVAPESSSLDDNWQIRNQSRFLGSEKTGVSDDWSVRGPRHQLPDEALGVGDDWSTRGSRHQLPDETTALGDVFDSYVIRDEDTAEAGKLADSWSTLNVTKFNATFGPNAASPVQIKFFAEIYTNWSIKTSLPMINFQIRMSSNAYPYCQIVTPGEYYSSIVANPKIIIYMGWYQSGVLIRSEILGIFLKTGISLAKSAGGETAIIECRFGAIVSPSTLRTNVSNLKVNYLNETVNTYDWDKIQANLSLVDPFVKPYSTLISGALGYTVTQVTITVGDSGQAMTILGLR